MPAKHSNPSGKKNLFQGNIAPQKNGVRRGWEGSRGQTSGGEDSGGGGMALSCLLLAWLVPGLGHIYLGDVKRGLILCITISSLFLSGLLMGGIGVVDYKLNRAWFFGQMFNGPAVVLAIVRTKTLMAHPQSDVGTNRYLGTPIAPNLYSPSFGRPNEIGILYTALAGLLNLFIFYDVLERAAPAPGNLKNKRPNSGTKVPGAGAGTNT